MSLRASPSSGLSNVEEQNTLKPLRPQAVVSNSQSQQKKRRSWKMIIQQVDAGLEAVVIFAP